MISQPSKEMRKVGPHGDVGQLSQAFLSFVVMESSLPSRKSVLSSVLVVLLQALTVSLLDWVNAFTCCPVITFSDNICSASNASTEELLSIVLVPGQPT